ncbi:MAG: AbrB/MazE/SpoVT family DNA-binding domain-containing protein [Candidatus Odinarchaeota archaeon]|nr:AbrB/MazE/SpoVT family DNA-binding domain-containing protein [Candidatus Odinarchaeota archaeon]
MAEIGKGKYIYGIVTVGERGQIVIPKEAREQFNIKPGDKLVIVGDLKKGIAIAKLNVMKKFALKLLGALSEEAEETATKEFRREKDSG